MPASKKIPEPWNSFLRELDEKSREETRMNCMGGFVVTQLFGFSRETSDLDVLLVAPKEQFKPLLDLSRQGESFTKSTRFIWTTWAWQKCQRAAKSVLRKCSRRRKSTSACAPSTLTIWRYPSWSGTFNAIAMMSNIWHARFHWISKSSKNGMRKSFAGNWEIKARGPNSQALDGNDRRRPQGRRLSFLNPCRLFLIGPCGPLT